MLQLPLPLRSEHRLTHIFTALHQIPLTLPHALVQQLQTCTSTKPPASWPLRSMQPGVSFASLPPHARRQLHEIDEEAQRLHWLYETCATNTNAMECESVSAYLNSPTTVTPPPAPPPLPTTTFNLRSPSSPQALCSIRSPPPVHEQARANRAASLSSRCPLLFLRMLMLARFPNYLLRLLKWLSDSQVMLCRQKQTCENEAATPARAECLAQLDRLTVHCAVMEEIAWKFVWRIDQILEARLLDACYCKLPDGSSESTSSWWSHECANKALRILASGEIALSDTAAFAFLDAVIGDVSIHTLTTSSQHHHTLRIGPIQNANQLPNFLYALTHTTPQATHDGMESLSMLLLRVPENGAVILNSQGWQTALVPLMIAGGRVTEKTDDALELMRSHRARAMKTLEDILHKEKEAEHVSERRASVVFATPTTTTTSTTTTMATHEQRTPETLLAGNIKLALNIWILLHFTHFISGDQRSMSSLLYESFDAIEDQIGWVPHTILLLRVLLVSLLTKIHSSTHKQRTFCGDVCHGSWSCLFDLLTVCECFIFYSPLAPTHIRKPTDPEPSPPSSRRTSSVQLHTSHGASIAPEFHGFSTSHLTRSKEERRFKTVGLHTDAFGVCEDAILVEKVLEFLQSLKLDELDTHLDPYADLADRERAKKLKKRGLQDLEFFQAVQAFFVQYSKKRLSAELKQSPALASSSTANSTPIVRSMPGLLEKRRQQRETASTSNQPASRLFSGMIQSLTRGRRMRHMEKRLNSDPFASPAAAQGDQTRSASAKSTSNEPHRPTTIALGRHLNLATRLHHARPRRSDKGSHLHAKLNLELVKLKIESQYLPHGRAHAQGVGSASARPVPSPSLQLYDVVTLSASPTPPPVTPPSVPARPHFSKAHLKSPPLRSSPHPSPLPSIPDREGSPPAPPIPPFTPAMVAIWRKSLRAPPEPLSPKDGDAMNGSKQTPTVPFTSHTHLSERPLPMPPKPLAIEVNSPRPVTANDLEDHPLDGAIPDLQVLGTIHLSPTHAAHERLRTFEPKEEH